jgi:hypothetical protein
MSDQDKQKKDGTYVTIETLNHGIKASELPTIEMAK